MEMPAIGLLRLAYNQMSVEINDVTTEISPGQRPAHGNVMEQLDFQDGLRLTDLARGAGMAPQSIGELVDELEELGMVERRPDPDDRRAKRIYRTDRAKEVSAEVFGIVLDMESRLEEMLGEDRLRELKSDLSRIVQAWGGSIPDFPEG